MSKNVIVMREKVINSMMNDIIRRFGFEDERTIRFCEIASNNNNLTVIKKLYQSLMNAV